MARRVIIDSWAFIEILRRGARAGDVRQALDDATERLTVREVVYETFGHLVHKTGTTHYAWEWLDGLLAADYQILEPSLEEIHGFAAAQDRGGNLSLADYAVAWCASKAGEQTVLTGDRGFRRLGLDPLFAPPE